MTRSWLLALVGSLLWAVSIGAENAPKAKGAEDAARDAAVLESVLVDLLSLPDSPIEPNKETDKQVFFSTTALTFRIDAAEVLRTSDDKQLEKLSKDRLASTREGAADLIRRAENKDVFKVFVPNDKRIIVYTEEQADLDKNLRSSKKPQVFRAYSPGYSRDKQVTIVHLSFGWSGNFHRAAGTYVLARQKDGWIVLLRDFIFFV